MDKLITDIIAALRENPTLDGRAVERIMRLHNGAAVRTANVGGATADATGAAGTASGAGAANVASDTRPFTKRRLMPYFLRVREAQPELWARWNLNSAEIAAITALLQVKPRRTMSGVATITLITAPHACRGGCIFCPTEAGMPKSYLSDEPACQRAVQSRFDPFAQVTRRLQALHEMGHPTGKVEFIILGGTWDDYPTEYRIEFVTEAFRALNEFGGGRVGVAQERKQEQKQEQAAKAPSDGDACAESDIDTDAACDDAAPFARLFAEQRKNETAACRCVGLVVETRPDCVTPKSLTFARALGATKIQVGVQSLDEGILAANGRPMSVEVIARAFALLRLFGFKSHVHVMLNLIGATPATDVANYRTLMSDPRFCPDEVKLYPCMLIRGAALEDAWREGRWVPYTHDTLTDALAGCLLATPPHTRVSRMIRDFSAQDIMAGDKTANLRQEVEALASVRAAAAGKALAEMRAREIVRYNVADDQLTLHELRYETSTGGEVFLQWTSPEGRLAAFLRLSLPACDLPATLAEGTPYAPRRAVIREVHVYGKTAQVGEGAKNAQHRGLGQALVRRAAELAQEAGYERLAVISAVGTRAYYERLGFVAPLATDPAHAATLYQELPLA